MSDGPMMRDPFEKREPVIVSLPKEIYKELYDALPATERFTTRMVEGRDNLHIITPVTFVWDNRKVEAP